MDLDWSKNLSMTGSMTALESRPLASPLLWVTTILAGCLVWYVREANSRSKVPFVSHRSLWDFRWKKAKGLFALDSRGVVARGFQQVGASKPFRVISELGEMLILPPHLAHDIRNIEQLSHAEFMKESTCAEVHGFEPFLESTGRSTLLSDVTRTKLIGNLKMLTEPVNNCTANTCRDIFPDDKEGWREMVLKDALLDLIARISSAIFLGDEEVSQDETWLRITKEYTVDSFIAAYQLRMYPKFLWPLAALFIPRVRKVRAQLRQAEAIIEPVIARRRAEDAQAKRKVERYDSIEWVEEVAQEKKIKYQPAAMQLTLALSAIHTTTDLLTMTMHELLQDPDTIQLLREEVVSVLPEGGIQHASLYNLKLMDSVLKEAQRIKPALTINMVRTATSDIRLPDGLSIPRGTRLGVSSHAAWDPAVFPEPEKFDPFRFVRLRERPGEENRWHLTTTRPEHIAFGHGHHACPGRFLAANELKIALCHLLLKYDWKLSPSTPAPKVITSGIMMDSDPTTKVLVRARTPEVAL